MTKGGDRPTCTLDGCSGAHKGHGYCGKHYQRWKKFGDPLHTEVKNPGVRGGTVLERIESIGWDVTADDCWEWRGHRAEDGYGIVRGPDGRKGQAHRLYYEALNGQIPRRIFVCHHCDNPPCMNPKHHFLGTALDNNQDRARKRRSSRGEGHYAHKLTWERVREIRSRYSLGQVSQQALADEFGVSQPVISGIVRHKGWFDVTTVQRCPAGTCEFQPEAGVNEAEVLRRHLQGASHRFSRKVADELVAFLG